MKKVGKSRKISKFVAAFFAAFAVCATVLALCGCDNKPKNVSEVRRGYYSAGDETMQIVAVAGEREQNYVADGVAGELVPYTLLTVVPSTFDPDAVYTYNITSGTLAFGGTLVVHPFAGSFSAEISEELSGEITVSITCGGTTYEYALASQVDGEFISYDKAIDAAQTELKPESGYEVRARLIKNPISDGLCWHVSFHDASGGQSGVLLDPVTAKVLAKKIS